MNSGRGQNKAPMRVMPAPIRHQGRQSAPVAIAGGAGGGKPPNRGNGLPNGHYVDAPPVFKPTPQPNQSMQPPQVPQTGMGDLPPEMKQHIISYLDGASRHNFAQTSRNNQANVIEQNRFDHPRAAGVLQRAWRARQARQTARAAWAGHGAGNRALAVYATLGGNASEQTFNNAMALSNEISNNIRPPAPPPGGGDPFADF